MHTLSSHTSCPVSYFSCLSMRERSPKVQDFRQSSTSSDPRHPSITRPSCLRVLSTSPHRGTCPHLIFNVVLIAHFFVVAVIIFLVIDTTDHSTSTTTTLKSEDEDINASSTRTVEDAFLVVWCAGVSRAGVRLSSSLYLGLWSADL